MTPLALIGAERVDVLGDYERFVDSIAVNSAQRSQRKLAARRFTQRHGDLDIWMTRPTATRLVDLQRFQGVAVVDLAVRRSTAPGRPGAPVGQATWC